MELLALTLAALLAGITAAFISAEIKLVQAKHKLELMTRSRDKWREDHLDWKKIW